MKKLEIIEMELYCLNSLKTTENNPILIENEINSYFFSSFCIEKEKWNINIPEFNF